MPVALEVDWTVIEKAAISGISYPDLAKTFDIPESAIRVRASREKWPVSFKRGPKSGVTSAETKAVTIASNQAVSKLKEATLADIHAATAIQLAQAAAKSLRRFSKAPAEIKDWQDASVAYKVQRLAAGVDKEGAAVTVNLAMFNGQAVTDDAAWDNGVTVDIPATDSP